MIYKRGFDWFIVYPETNRALFSTLFYQRGSPCQLPLISGGQTGIDQLGMEVASSLGIPTGGIAPEGYLTENGPDVRLHVYGLTEHTSANYPPRTRANVQQSDGTVMLGNLSGGTQQTLDYCIREK